MSKTTNCEVCKKALESSKFDNGNKNTGGFICWSCYNSYMQKKNHTRMIREGNNNAKI